MTLPTRPRCVPSGMPSMTPDGRYVAFYADTGEVEGASARQWNILVVPLLAGKTWSEAELKKMVVAKGHPARLSPAVCKNSRREERRELGIGRRELTGLSARWQSRYCL